MGPIMYSLVSLYSLDVVYTLALDVVYTLALKKGSEVCSYPYLSFILNKPSLLVHPMTRGFI